MSRRKERTRTEDNHAYVGVTMRWIRGSLDPAYALSVVDDARQGMLVIAPQSSRNTCTRARDNKLMGLVT